MALSPSLANNTIELNISSSSPYYESYVVAGNTVYPGMVCYFDAFGDVRPVQTSGSHAEALIAVENAYSGGTMYTPYTEGTRVMLRYLRLGDVFFTKVYGTTNLVISQALTMNGNGWLRQAASGDTLFAVSLEGAPLAELPRWTRVRLSYYGVDL